MTNKTWKELKQNPWFFVSLFLVLILVLLGYQNLKPNVSGNTCSIESEITQSPIMSSGAILGDSDAKVTITEYSDYECPFCARFFTGAYPQIKSEYIETGKVKLEFKDFPLSFHANAQKAAEAAKCSGEQDKYFQMHDKLFGLGVVGGVNTFKKYAKDIDLDTDKFDQCLDSGKYASQVQAEFREGQQKGVSGTPTFFINDQKIVGAQPFEAFQQIIEQELNK
ncbi:DsbA family protein [Candidatus Pacearchaeota archaeon]|nr:DsbA family protein [Candidatus Pacearchaeota archaeon]